MINRIITLSISKTNQTLQTELLLRPPQQETNFQQTTDNKLYRLCWSKVREPTSTKILNKFHTTQEAQTHTKQKSS